MKIKPIRTKVFKKGQNLIKFLLQYIVAKENSVVVVTSKIVALAEERVVAAKNKEKLVRQESDFYLNVKTWFTMKDGMVMPKAGIDESNANGKLILLPKDSFKSAENIRKSLQKKFKIKNLGILITDSGELTTWRKSYPLGDWFGTTLYRTVWSPIFSQIDYPIPPIFYKLKMQIIKALVKNYITKNIIVELQAEPWATAKAHISKMPIDEQIKLFPVKKLQSNVEYARQTGFEEIYLWGVEWWYWMKAQGHPEYIKTARQLYNN